MREHQGLSREGVGAWRPDSRARARNEAPSSFQSARARLPPSCLRARPPPHSTAGRGGNRWGFADWAGPGFWANAWPGHLAGQSRWSKWLSRSLDETSDYQKYVRSKQCQTGGWFACRAKSRWYPGGQTIRTGAPRRAPARMVKHARSSRDGQTRMVKHGWPESGRSGMVKQGVRSPAWSNRVYAHLHGQALVGHTNICVERYPALLPRCQRLLSACVRA